MGDQGQGLLWQGRPGEGREAGTGDQCVEGEAGKEVIDLELETADLNHKIFTCAHEVASCECWDAIFEALSWAYGEGQQSGFTKGNESGAASAFEYAAVKLEAFPAVAARVRSYIRQPQ